MTSTISRFNDKSDFFNALIPVSYTHLEWNQEDGHVQSETTYDTLINEYVDIETEKEKLEVDLEHKKKLLAVFTDGAQSDDMSLSLIHIFPYSVQKSAVFPNLSMTAKQAYFLKAET